MCNIQNSQILLTVTSETSCVLKSLSKKSPFNKFSTCTCTLTFLLSAYHACTIIWSLLFIFFMYDMNRRKVTQNIVETCSIEAYSYLAWLLTVLAQKASLELVTTTINNIWNNNDKHWFYKSVSLEVRIVVNKCVTSETVSFR